VSGIAPQIWIEDARKFARALPGIEAFDSRKLLDQETDNIRKRVEETVIRFVTGKDIFLPGQNQIIGNLLTDITRLVEKEPTINRNIRIEIVGHTDSEGDAETNLRLSQQRADRLLSIFTSRGLGDRHFQSTGIGTQSPIRPENTPEDRQYNRSVSFKISLEETR